MLIVTHCGGWPARRLMQRAVYPAASLLLIVAMHFSNACMNCCVVPHGVAAGSTFCCAAACREWHSLPMRPLRRFLRQNITSNLSNRRAYACRAASLDFPRVARRAKGTKVHASIPQQPEAPLATSTTNPTLSTRIYNVRIVSNYRRRLRWACRTRFAPWKGPTMKQHTAPTLRRSKRTTA